MKLTGHLKPLFDRWDDPGDYPSGAGGGPLPSTTYCADLTGTLHVEGTNDEREAIRFAESEEPLARFVVKWDAKRPAGVPGVIILIPKDVLLDNIRPEEWMDQAELENTGFCED